MNQFISQRKFSVTPEELFAAVENPEVLAEWWGPEGFSCEFSAFDFKENGVWIFTMIGPDGSRYPNENRFVSINKPDEIVILHDAPPHFTVILSIEKTDEGSILHFKQVFAEPGMLEKLLPIIEPANEQVFDKLERVLME